MSKPPAKRKSDPSVAKAVEAAAEALVALRSAGCGDAKKVFAEIGYDPLAEIRKLADMTDSLEQKLRIHMYLVPFAHAMPGQSAVNKALETFDEEVDRILVVKAPRSIPTIEAADREESAS